MSSRDPRDERLVEIFKSSGWFDGRHVAVEPALSAWRANGHVPTPAASEFVAEFDGLSFKYPRRPLVGGEDNCLLDAVAAVEGVFSSVVREYEVRVGEILCPVGKAASAHIVLMVAKSGRVYGGYDQFLALYGIDGRDAIVNIFDRTKPIKLT